MQKQVSSFQALQTNWIRYVYGQQIQYKRMPEHAFVWCLRRRAFFCFYFIKIKMFVKYRWVLFWLFFLPFELLVRPILFLLPNQQTTTYFSISVRLAGWLAGRQAGRPILLLCFNLNAPVFLFNFSIPCCCWQYFRFLFLVFCLIFCFMKMLNMLFIKINWFSDDNTVKRFKNFKSSNFNLIFNIKCCVNLIGDCTEKCKIEK